jgi:hypothetical protein
LRRVRAEAVHSCCTLACCARRGPCLACRDPWQRGRGESNPLCIYIR